MNKKKYNKFNRIELLGLLDSKPKPVSYSGLLEAFLFSFGSSYKLRQNISRISNSQNETEKENQRFRTMLSRLKTEGLIEKNGILFSLTSKGKSLISKSKLYEAKKSDSVILVTFDIPEKKRNVRNWLRERLRELEFTMLRQSVWIGKNKIPANLIKDLQKIEMMKYIDIVEITKKGTIEKV